MIDGIDRSLAQATSSLGISNDQDHEVEAKTTVTMGSSPRGLDFPVPTSSIVGDKRLWDITDKFRRVASVLPVGTLVKDENFTLFESVGALEIMDPKMDSGCLAPGEALVDEYDLERPLLPEEIVGIMDQFLCCEVAWHEGYPLAQTLFSSHYIDKLLSLEAKSVGQIHFTDSGKENVWSAPLLHVVLRAYSIALIKCCDYALEEINRSLDGGGTRCNFYEEEDFSGHTYGRELFTRIPLNPIVNLLFAAVEFIEAEKGHSTNGQRKSTPEVYEAIKVRMESRILLLRAMATEEDIDDKFKFWGDIPKSITKIKTTHGLGKPVTESFSPKIQRRLASTVPPKPMVELGFEDASTKLNQMCNDCREAVKIVNFGPDNVQSLKAFLWSFSSRKPEPWTYPRACLAAPLFSCDDAGFEQLLRKDLENIVLPASEVLDPINWTVETPQGRTSTPNRRFEMAKTINQFTEMGTRMPGGYVDYFRTLTSNRCRLRRNLTHVAMALEDLQTRETEHLDESLHKLGTDDLQFPLSTWTYFQKLRAMEWIVQLGFELDLYLPDELAGMYWYLSLLSSSRFSLLELILPIIEARAAKQRVLSNEIISESEIDQSIAFLQSLKLEAQGTSALASALSSIYIYLSYLGLIPEVAPNSAFYQPQLKHELRMKPFLTIKSPELPTYDEWHAALHPCGEYHLSAGAFVATRELYVAKIDDGIKDAKTQFAAMKKMGAAAAGCKGVEDAWSKNMSVLLQSCIAAGITLSTLKTKSEEENLQLEIPPAEKGRYHDWWIVPKIAISGGKQ